MSGSLIDAYSSAGSSLGSTLTSSLGSTGALFTETVASVLLKPFRSIGFIFPDVVVEERGEDILEITEHPVELGASITDHAYKRPSEVTIKAGFSDCNRFPGYADIAYAGLLVVQSLRTPVIVVTGKRVYPTMLIASLSQTTNMQNESSLDLTIVCREVILVQTVATTLPPAANQAMPSSTASPVSAGDVQPAVVSNPPSMLYQLSHPSG